MIKVVKNNSRLEKIYRIEPGKDTRLNKLRLDKNERANQHSSKIIKKIKSSITSDLISAYPEFYNLYKKIAKKFKINKKNLIITAGSDQGLKNCFEIFYKKKTNIITLNPTFAMVDIYCKVFKSNQIKIGYNKNLELNLKTLINSIKADTSLIIIANPNSPTGSILKLNDIKKIISKAKSKGATVVIDEAYFEFSNYNCIKLIKYFNNLVILRTFSKMFGIAGLRLGYAVSSEENIKKFKSLKPMYEANSVAIKAGEILLDNYSIIKSYLKEMREGEKFAIKFCNKRNIKFIKTYANFFHIDLGSAKEKITKILYKNDILVRGGPSVKGYEDYLRISFANLKTIKKTLKIIDQYRVK